MPVLPTYPGVYIEELSSGVRTITGVATSITAFIGRARRGDTDKATTITSYADYQRLFGGSWDKSMMSYAVRDFYMNGGSRALIVRIAKDATNAEVELPTMGSPAGTLTLEAANPGAWANTITVSVNHNTKDTSDTKLFNLIITEGPGGSIEKHLNVSVDAANARYVERVLAQSSMLLRVKGAMPADRPASTEALSGSPAQLTDTPIAVSVDGDDGDDVTSTEYKGDALKKSGLWAFDNEDFNLLCIPPPVRDGDTDKTVYSDAVVLCVNNRAMLIVDSPFAWGDTNVSAVAVANAIANLTTDLNISGDNARNAALFFPRIKQADPERDNQIEVMAPCGVIAGIMARTDTSRGVWKSPAGTDASLNGVQGLQVVMSDNENGLLNPLAINCLRSFPVTGRVVWGTRTMKGADQLADEYKYIAVRRTAMFIEESLYRGTQWVVFEPNDEPLWAQIRLNVGAFMHNLFRQGAFQGKTPKEAYLVKCDKETTTQNDINSGIVNILVGFAPLKPAEFVMIKIQQLAGQIES